MALCLCWREGVEGMASARSLIFREVLTCPEINMSNSLFTLPIMLCKLMLLCCLSMKAAVFLRIATQLSLSLLDSPVVNQLSFKAPSCKSHWPYKHIQKIQPLWFAKPNLMSINLSHMSSLVWGPITLCTVPFLLWTVFLCLSDLPNLSDASL